MKTKFLLVAVLLFASIGTQAQAAVVNFFESTSAGIINVVGGERRQTLLEVLAPVRINALRAQLNPTAPVSGYTWSIFEATQDEPFGGPAVFSQSVDFPNADFTTYSIATDLLLNPGFYTMELLSAVSTGMARYDEANENLPFVAGGLFRILNGGANGSLGVDTLPSFGVDAVAAPVSAVPLPAALPLLATALGGLGILTWRRKRSPA